MPKHLKILMWSFLIIAMLVFFIPSMASADVYKDARELCMRDCVGDCCKEKCDYAACIFEVWTGNDMPKRIANRQWKYPQRVCNQNNRLNILWSCSIRARRGDPTLPGNWDLPPGHEQERPPIKLGPGMENNIVRNFYDYDAFFLDRPDPRICQNRCARENKCRAWTYFRPGIKGTKAKCFLKEGVPKPIRNTCCISGVK